MKTRDPGDNSDQAVIIGAGPAGLTAAIALHRIGVPVALYERAPELGGVGGGLGVQSNALRALRKLDLGGAIERAGSEVRHQEIRDRSGRLLFSFPLGEVADAYGTPTISLMRADVQVALVGAVPEGVLRLGCECVSAGQDGEAVSATFADGSIVRGSLLIGADGGGSVVRRYVYGEHDAPPRYSGFTSWRGVVRMDPDVLPTDTSRTFLGRGRQFVMFPVGDHRIYWGLMIRAREGSEDPPRLRERLLGELIDFPDVSRELVQATDEEAIIHTDIYDRTPAGTWRRGRVLLIGDAAHMTTPFVGQGAGISIEDAVVLAKELSLTGVRDWQKLDGALRSFERTRVPRGRQIVLSSRRRGEVLGWSNPAFATLRNAILRAVPASAWRKATADSIGYDI